MNTLTSPVPLWRQLQATSAVLLAVVQGRSLTEALSQVRDLPRPGVQALAFEALRSWGAAQALRARLAPRAPAPRTDALLCLALALLGGRGAPSYEPHTVVDQATEAAKRLPATRHQAGFINACLRRYLRESEALQAAIAGDGLARWNHPAWWVQRLQRDYPQHWQDILDANLQRAPLILRINPRKTSVQAYAALLQDQGLDAQPVGHNGLMLAASTAVTELPHFADGWLSVQDAAAQMAAPLLLDGLQPAGTARLRLLDACAAPGGKTAHLLELADAEVTALEIDARRAERIHENLDRLGLQAQVTVADAADVAVWHAGPPYDGILLDAPCSASGIVRRHPDIPWLRRASDIDQLARIQQQLLARLWPLVRPGGRLLYCTCSVFHAEGEGQIVAFLARHNDARRLPAPGHLLPPSAQPAGQIADNAQREHDGFYYALLEKRQA